MFDVMVPNHLLEKADALVVTLEGVVKSEEPNKYVCDNEAVVETFARGVFVQ